MIPLLEIKNLDITFPHGSEQIRCTDRVGFSIDPGEILCIVGESGCGKSITALSVLHLLGRQGKVSGGEILYRGQNLLAMTDKQLDAIRGREISMIFQDIMASLNPVLSIGCQMTEGIRRHLGYGKRQANDMAVELLAKTGIQQPESMMRKYPHMLSGGMRQRVMIAMALACRPKLLIADEPTTALDVTIQMQIIQLLKSLRSEYGMAICMITHDIGVVVEMADRVVVMYAGQCVEKGDVRDVLEDPLHPYTQALLRSVPDVRASRGLRLQAIPGTVPENYQGIGGCRFAPRCVFAGSCTCENCEWEPDAYGHYARCCRAFENRQVPYAAS